MLRSKALGSQGIYTYML